MEIGQGTRVLVTGASRGIGKAIADAFEARGSTVGRVSRSGPLAADVADAESIAAAVAEFGDVDVLVANAGITHYRPFAEQPLDEARQMNDVNWLGTIHTVRAALPHMIERGRGHIVVISSGGGVRPRAARHGRVGDHGLPGGDRDLVPRPRARPHAGLVSTGSARVGRPAGRAGG